jgi:hypothetical protein
VAFWALRGPLYGFFWYFQVHLDASRYKSLNAVALVEFSPDRTRTDVGRSKTSSIGTKIRRVFFNKQNRLVSKRPFDFAHIWCFAGQATEVVLTPRRLGEAILTNSDAHRDFQIVLVFSEQA